MIYARLENQSYSITMTTNTERVLYYSNATVVDSTYFTVGAVPYNTISFLQQGTYLVNAGQSWVTTGSAAHVYHIYIQLLTNGALAWQNIAAQSIQSSINNTGIKTTMASVAYRFFPGDVIRASGKSSNPITTIAPASNVASGAAFPFLSVALCLP
jgi:hypothetical protein